MELPRAKSVGAPFTRTGTEERLCLSPQLPTSRLEVEQVGPVTVVRFPYPVIANEKIIDGMGEQLYSLVEKAAPPQLLLDFRAVQQVASSLLATLIGVRRMVKAHGGRLVLCGIGPELRRSFEMTRLIQVFDIRPTEQEALQGWEPG